MNTRHLLILLAALPLCADAQQVWRCGPDGRSYSNVPCAEGRQLEVPDSRPTADVAAAQARAAHESRQAEQARRTRLAEETRLRGNGLGAIAEPVVAVKPPVKPGQKVQRHAPAKPGTWQATVPGSRHAKG